MAKKLDDTESLSTQSANDLSEKRENISIASKSNRKKLKEGSSDALISKDT